MIGGIKTNISPKASSGTAIIKMQPMPRQMGFIPLFASYLGWYFVYFPMSNPHLGRHCLPLEFGCVFNRLHDLVITRNLFDTTTHSPSCSQSRQSYDAYPSSTAHACTPERVRSCIWSCLETLLKALPVLLKLLPKRLDSLK